MLVAIEGTDGSGKTTLVDELCKFYHNKQINVCVFRFPTRENTTGALIDSVLKKEKSLDPLVFQYIFAANRLEMQPQINRALKNFPLVILDRYTDSGLIYAATQDIDPMFVRDLDRHVRQPDACIYLKAAPEICLKRCKQRSQGEGKGNEIYEKEAFQKKAASLYDTCYTDATKPWTTVAKFPDMKVHILDASRSQDAVVLDAICYIDEHILNPLFTPPQKTPQDKSYDSGDSNS